MTNKDQHPAILYKYIDTTGGLSMLQKEELWFRRTGFLNDPYDCYLSHECQGKYPEFSVSFDLNELTKYFGRHLYTSMYQTENRMSYMQI